MPVIPAFGMPGPVELLVISVLILPVVVLICFLHVMRKQNEEAEPVPDERSLWGGNRWAFEVTKLVGIIGGCFLAWYLLR